MRKIGYIIQFLTEKKKARDEKSRNRKQPKGRF